MMNNEKPTKVYILANSLVEHIINKQETRTVLLTRKDQAVIYIDTDSKDIFKKRTKPTKNEQLLMSKKAYKMVGIMGMKQTELCSLLDVKPPHLNNMLKNRANIQAYYKNICIIFNNWKEKRILELEKELSFLSEIDNQ